MEYVYPKIDNCLTYKRCGKNSFEVTDFLTDEVYDMDLAEVRFVRKLDGKTHPYAINTPLTKEEIDSLIIDLEDYGLLKESNKRDTGDGTILRTLWEPKWPPFLRLVAFLCNKLLIVSWLPVLIIGIFMFIENVAFLESDLMWIGALLGMVSGLLLHELGHAFAGVSYGAGVFEMGVLLMYYVIPGAYVIMDDAPVKNRLKRVQINAAGVETNIFLVGAFLILGSIFTDLSGMFFTAAINNILLAALNLTFIKGFDGAAIIGELLGIEDVIEKASRITFSRKHKRKVRERGLAGHATIAASYIICAFQVALPLVLVINILEVIGCFV